MAAEVEIDVEVLKSEIKKTYASVSQEPEKKGEEGRKQREAAGVDHGQASGDKRDRDRDRVHPAALSASRSHCSSGSPVMPESVR